MRAFQKVVGPARKYSRKLGGLKNQKLLRQRQWQFSLTTNAPTTGRKLIRMLHSPQHHFPQPPILETRRLNRWSEVLLHDLDRRDVAALLHPPRPRAVIVLEENISVLTRNRVASVSARIRPPSRVPLDREPLPPYTPTHTTPRPRIPSARSPSIRKNHRHHQYPPRCSPAGCDRANISCQDAVRAPQPSGPAIRRPAFSSNSDAETTSRSRLPRPAPQPSTPSRSLPRWIPLAPASSRRQSRCSPRGARPAS
jgi:hypothetical protein